MKIRRSPLFYVGDKYKLMEQLIGLFPLDIENFVEPFVGGGTVFLNVKAKKYSLNDLDRNLIKLHQYLIRQSKESDIFFNEIEEKVKRYNLSRSYMEDIVSQDLKNQWKKTYYAKHNKKGYEKLKNNFNAGLENEPLAMYLLLIYGFNRMLRFNSKGSFNLPVGNVDFNKNVVNALNDYFRVVQNRDIVIENHDFKDFLKNLKLSKSDFVYVDPPYLITSSEYNKLWDEKCEKELLSLLDELNSQGVRFALSNVTFYRGRKNELLINWMKKYNAHKIKSNYISFNNNSIKEIEEVLVTNYVIKKSRKI